MNGHSVSTGRALSYIFKAAPLSYLVMALMGLFNGGAAVLSSLCVQRIFTLVEGGYTADLFWTLAAYGAVLLLSAVYLVWYIRYRVQFVTLLNFESAIRKKLHFKSRRISNDRLETPDCYAFIRQADGARQNLFRFGEIYVESVMIVVQAAMVTAYVSSFELWFLLFLPLAVLPVLLEMLYEAKLWNAAYEGVTQAKREEAEYERAMTDEIACKETRLTGADGLLMQKYRESHAARDKSERSRARKMFALRLALSVFACAGTIGGFLVSILLLYFGRIELSVFTASIAAYSSLSTMLRGLASTAGNEAQYKKMIMPYFSYADLPERAGRGEHCTFEESITLKDVSFRYPEQSEDALRHIDLTIQKGEVLAIVGENGAGKSTLAAIALGLYAPTEGAVLYDGTDIASVKEEKVHEGQSAVLQHFVKYKLTAGENIRIADFEKGGDVSGEIESIFEGKLSENAMLGKEFGGAELSGGEWQKLAIARGFYKDAQFVVLDEPTSAIDPLKERALLEEFRRGLRGRTGLIVTHRLAAVNIADKIVVLKEGRVLEYGTKQELLARQGAFYTYWNSQAEAFEG